MLWLGLAISCLYVPGWTGATVQTSWAVLSLSLPALTLWRSVELTVLHWAVLCFVGVSVLSNAWAVNHWDAPWGTWQIILFALAFFLGSTLSDLRQLFKGLAIGASFSAVVLFIQLAGLHPVLTFGADSSGLYYNSMYAGEIFALIILGCYLYRLYWFIPLLALALAFSGSHAGWIALAIGIVVSRFRSLYLILIGILATAVAFTFHLRPSDIQRLQIWDSAWQYLTPFGHGPGSFLSVWFPHAPFILFPEYVHNDFLQLVFEYGALAIVPFYLYLALACSKRSYDWPIWIAFCFMATVSFPLYTPILGFIGACVAGRISRNWGLCWDDERCLRLDFLPRGFDPRPSNGLARGEALPMVSRS